MKRFFLAIAGSFIGKILAGLVLSICIAIGFGPDRWASWILEITPELIPTFRWLFRIVAILGMLLIAGWFAAKASFVKTRLIWLASRLRKSGNRVRKRVRYWKKRIYGYWQFLGPNDYEVLRPTQAIGRPHFANFQNDRVAFSHRFAERFLERSPPRLSVFMKRRQPLSMADERSAQKLRPNLRTPATPMSAWLPRTCFASCLTRF
jgi:hypothetical protein